MNIPINDMETFYPVCRTVMGDYAWRKAMAVLPDSRTGSLPDAVEAVGGLPGYLSGLAQLEEAYRQASETGFPAEAPERISVNPTLQMLELSWTGLASFFGAAERADSVPEAGDEIVIVWRRTPDGDVVVRPATDADLLALKIIVEEVDPEEAAAAAELPVGVIDAAVASAADDGVLLRPPSRIRRRAGEYPLTEEMDRDSLVAETFTLQWHITQTCDLHCRHCYDRTDRLHMSIERGLAVLDDMRNFCGERSVRGHVTFSGGNPLMHPDFMQLYGAAVDRGMSVGILGNPCSRWRLTEITAIAAPSYYQVSLEGLREHNDSIRGRGHFDRTMAFLDLLKETGVYSMVMLTLTSDNMDQVVPLGLMLKDKTESFNFNRLSPVGEGASLALPDQSRFAAFLEEYLDARDDNPHLRLKDNLFNPVLEGRGLGCFDGCTGHGCGAAFNFISVLADGEAHACRKFPSVIGNVYESGISEVYDSGAAKRYRRGAEACDGCGLRAHCGGCMSVAYGTGLDPFTARDPFCLRERTG